MSNQKISEKTAATTVADADVVVIVQGTTTKKLTWALIKSTLRTAFDLVYSPLTSPTFTGVPVAPTAAAGTNTTQVATTAFVKALGDTKAPVAGPGPTGDFGVKALTAAGQTQAPFFTTAAVSLSAANGVPTTLFTLPSQFGIYSISAFVYTTDAPAYLAHFMVGQSLTSTKIISQSNGTNITLAMSGLDVVVTQSQGTTQIVYGNYTKLA